MGLLDKLINVLSMNTSYEREYDEIISDSLEECEKAGESYYNIKISTATPYVNKVSSWNDKTKVDFILHSMRKTSDFHKETKFYNTREKSYKENIVRSSFIIHLFKTKIVFDDDEIENLVDAFFKYDRWGWSSALNWPLGSFVALIEKQFKDTVPSQRAIASLTDFKDKLKHTKKSFYEKDKLKIIERVDQIIFRSVNSDETVKPVLFLGDDEFTSYANGMIESFPEEDKKIWYVLIAKAQKVSGSKPSKKYLDETKDLFKQLSADRFKKTVNDWLKFLYSLKDKTTTYTNTYNNQTYTYNVSSYLSPINIETIKGFVWMCSHFHDSSTIDAVSRLAERCFRKIPGKGPAAAAIGNACLYALYSSKGLDGIGQLSRLKLRVKQSSTQQIIEKYLLEAAAKQGVTLHEIEDIAVDDHDLSGGEKEITFDDYKAVLKISAPGKSELSWFKADGTQQKSVPAFVKEKHAAKLKKLKDSQKQIDLATSAQRDRIDRMFRADRKWKFGDFKTHYLDHGLMSFLAKKIIWTIADGEQKDSAIFFNNQWQNNDGQVVVPSENSAVSLWHPADATVSEIKKWRDFLVENKFQQPLKQAFREVYLLTDAEINTKTYSNRMAAHVLKQHQFNSLAKTRGWKYTLLGAYDNGMHDMAASVNLPEYKLRAEYWVNELNAEDAYNDTGIWNYITTDQVRFINTEKNETIDLIDVPVIALSEVLRDVDLFVGVASVGNDPTWQDTGGVPAYRDYWQSYSFGDLSEVAKSRKEILVNLVPPIKDKQGVRDKRQVPRRKRQAAYL